MFLRIIRGLFSDIGLGYLPIIKLPTTLTRIEVMNETNCKLFGITML